MADWLRVRGWTLDGRRWRHHSVPVDVSAMSLTDAMLITRSEPLRYRARR